MANSGTTDNSGVAELMDGPADLVYGTFSNDPPWLIDPDKLAWHKRLVSVRDTIARSVPKLISPNRVPSPVRLAQVTARFGSSVAIWYVTDRRKGGSASKAGISRRLRGNAETLGPTFIKLAQIISSGEGLFPTELVEECKKCRDQVPAEPFDVVREVVESELGGSIESHFASFERTPIAAASIAQVHAATLPDGTEVVVKVQRPSVAKLVHADIGVLARIAPYLVGRIQVAALANPPALVELFASTITEELDFRLEAENMLDVAASLRELGQTHYVVPRPHPELVTTRVLVMERFNGFNFDDVVGMTDAGIDTVAVVRGGMIAFLEGAMLKGLFHGDLHGGNLLVLEDGRVGLLDYGITARMTPLERQGFLKLTIAATMNDLPGQLGAMIDLGAIPPDTDIAQMIEDLDLEAKPMDPTSATPQELLAEVQRLVKGLLAYGARMPKILMLYVKNMIFLDGAIARLAPDLDLFAELEHISTHFAMTHGETIAAQIGFDPATWQMDLSGMKETFGVDGQTESFTYSELREQRELIQQRFAHDRKGRRKR